MSSEPAPRLPRPPRRRRLIVVGAAVIVTGLVGAVVLFVVGDRRGDRAVEQLARAPVGCDTVLEFSGTGTFVVYVETAGRIEQLDGGCDAPTTYDRRGARPPEVSIELTGPGGDEVVLRATDAEGYASDGFVGEPTAEISIDDRGRHLMRVTSDDGDFAVSVGRDPSGVATPFTAAAALIALVGLVGGLMMMAIGVVRSRRAETPVSPVDSPSPEFRPDATAPTAVPLAPPPPGAVVTPPPAEAPAEPSDSPSDDSPWAPPPSESGPPSPPPPPPPPPSSRPPQRPLPPPSPDR